MARILAFGYGVICYLLFLLTFLYAIGFLGNIVVPKTIDGGPAARTYTRAIIADVILMSIFALQHSIMARPAFKRLWTRVIPPAIERSSEVSTSETCTTRSTPQRAGRPSSIARTKSAMPAER